MRAIAPLFEEALRLTQAYVGAEEQLAADRASQSTAARLGMLLKQRNFKIGDVLRSWYKDGSGQIDCRQFQLQVHQLGFRASAEEVDALFREIDEDGSGALDHDELKSALKKLQEAAAISISADQARAKQLAGAKKAAKSAQMVAQREEAKEQHRSAAAEAAAESAAAEKAAAEAAREEAEKEAARANWKLAARMRRQSVRASMAVFTSAQVASPEP